MYRVRGRVAMGTYGFVPYNPTVNKIGIERNLKWALSEVCYYGIQEILRFSKCTIAVWIASGNWCVSVYLPLFYLHILSYFSFHKYIYFPFVYTGHKIRKVIFVNSLIIFFQFVFLWLCRGIVLHFLIYRCFRGHKSNKK